MQRYTTLISAAELSQALAVPAPEASSAVTVRLIDCRSSLTDPEHGPRVFLEGHLPGAVYGSIDADFAGPPGPGGRHPLPHPDALAARFQAWGVNDVDQVVVYDDAGGAFAARAWWCTRWLGHPRVAVLDGGMGAWQGMLESSAAGPPPPGNFSVRRSLTRTVNANKLLSSGLTLVDARTRARFEGDEEPIDPVAGHIPGARCMPFQDNLIDTGALGDGVGASGAERGGVGRNGRFKTPAELRRRFRDLPANVVCYCGSGVTATHNILAMRVAGLAEPILYPGSWSEWLQDPERPIARRS